MTREARVLAPAAVLAVAAAIWVGVTTRHGLTGDADSNIYLGTAHALVAGHGPTVPFTYYWDRYLPQTAVNFHGHVPSTHFPPGYPIALAVSSAVAGSVQGAARLLDVVLVAINVFLVSLLAARLTSYRSAVAATLPALMLALYPDRVPGHRLTLGWMTVHQRVASEPLFIALFLAALIVAPAAFAADRERARRALIGVGALAGAALLTRYAGIALVLTVGLALLTLDVTRRFARRALRVSVFLACALAPILVFLVWAAAAGGGAARAVSYHPQHGDLSAITQWFGRFLLPPAVPGPLRTAALVLVVGAVSIVVVAPSLTRAIWRDDDALLLARIAVVSIPCYVIVLVFSRAYLDPHVPLDPRLLGPIRGVWLALVVAVAWGALANTRLEPVRSRAVLVAVVACGLVVGWRTQQGILTFMPPTPAATTEVARAVTSLPGNALIAGNVPDLLWRTTGRSSVALPSRRDYLSNKINSRYNLEIRDMASILAQQHGYVYFEHPVRSYRQTATPADLERYVKLVIVTRDTRDVVYAVEPGRRAREPALSPSLSRVGWALARRSS